jgi:exodeoxyribonuclease VII small subunit
VSETGDQTPLSFEQALARLDDIVARLEGGEIGLEEAVVLFEDGQRHLAICRERLDVAQARIDELTASELPAVPDPESSEPFSRDGPRDGFSSGR